MLEWIHRGDLLQNGVRVCFRKLFVNALLFFPQLLLFLLNPPLFSSNGLQVIISLLPINQPNEQGRPSCSLKSEIEAWFLGFSKTSLSTQRLIIRSLLNNDSNESTAWRNRLTLQCDTIIVTEHWQANYSSIVDIWRHLGVPLWNRKVNYLKHRVFICRFYNNSKLTLYELK